MQGMVILYLHILQLLLSCDVLNSIVEYRGCTDTAFVKCQDVARASCAELGKRLPDDVRAKLETEIDMGEA